MAAGKSRNAFAGLAALVSGLGFLYLSAPHVNPWDLSCLDAGDAWGTFRLQCLGAVEDVPTWVVAALSVVCVLAPLLVHRDLRATLALTLRRRRALLGTAASVTILLFTLVPTDRSIEILLGMALGSAGVGLVAAGIVALCPRLGTAVAGVAGTVARRVADAPRWAFIAIVFGFFFIACGLGNALLFGRIPHVVDEMDQLFHARMFLEGRVTVPPPVPLEAFDLTHMISGQAWYSQYPPGHTLLLSLGLWLGVPWIINALFGSLTVVLLYWLGRELYHENVGRIAAVLGAMSPFLLLMSSSFMNHTTTSFFFLLFCLFFARMARLGGILNALVAGGALGYAVTIRQMDAVVAAVPMAVYAVVRLRSRGPSWAGWCGIALAAFGVPVAGLLAFNDATNGSPWVSGFEVLNGANALPGFGHSGWWGIPHTPARGLEWTLQNLAGLHQYLFGWPIPSLLFAIVGFSWLRPRVWDWLLGTSVVALSLAYATYWYHDWTLGPRFMYSATGPLLLLTARSLDALGDRLRSPRLASVRPELLSTCVLILMLSSAYAAIVTVPALARYYSRHYFDGNASIVRAVEARHLHNALVFVPAFHFPSFFPLNDPLLNGDVVYARDHWDAGNREVMARYSGRRYYRIHSFEDYEVLPYVSPQAPGDGLYALAQGRPLTIEALTSQMGLLEDCVSRNRKTGEFGSGWKNHDYLEVFPRQAESEVGFAIAAGVAEVRTASLVLTRAPSYGIVSVVLNETMLREVDLYSPVLDTVDLTLPQLHFEPGVNFLILRVVGKNPASESFGIGLDYLRILPAGDSSPGGF